MRRLLILCVCMMLVFVIQASAQKTLQVGTLEDLEEKPVEPYPQNLLVITPRENFVGTEMITLRATDKSGKSSETTLTVRVTAAPIISELPTITFTTASASSISIPLKDEIIDDSPFEELQLRVEPESNTVASCTIDGTGDEMALKCDRVGIGTQEFTLFAKDPDDYESSAQFDVESVEAPAADYYKYTCQRNGRHCGYADFSCPAGKGNPPEKVGCCPENAPVGLFASFGICTGDLGATVRYECTDTYQTTCGGTCDPSYSIVAQEPCTPTCNDGTPLGSCSLTSGYKCLTAFASPVLDTSCGCPDGYTQVGAECKSDCSVLQYFGDTRTFHHGECVGDGRAGDGYMVQRCNDGSLVQDYGCIKPCVDGMASYEQREGGCTAAEYGTYRCSPTTGARQRCSGWTPYTNWDDRACAGWTGYDRFAQCLSGQICQNGGCIAAPPSACLTNGCSTEGARECNGVHTKVCEKDNDNNCLRWVTYNCAVETHCSSGSCINCNDAGCTVDNLNLYKCYGSGADITDKQQCIFTGNCYKWSTPPTSCGFNTYGIGKVCPFATYQPSDPCRDRLEVTQTSKTVYTVQCDHGFSLKNNQNSALSIRDVVGIYSGGSDSFGDPNLNIAATGNFGDTQPYSPPAAVHMDYTHLEFRDVSGNSLGKIAISCP